MNFLIKNSQDLLGWECTCCAQSDAKLYDYLVTEFRDILRPYSLTGYHCTRLTYDEINNIYSSGMTPQDGHSLSMRIDRLYANGEIDHDVARMLKDENQANDNNRMGMMWFCFSEPLLADEMGVGRLFSYWGGEALYNSHERNPLTSDILSHLGTPCIIKAHVEISSMACWKFPDSALLRVFMAEKGHIPKSSLSHEGYSRLQIPHKSIVDIIEYPSDKFLELTGCNQWKRYTIF